MWILFEDSSVHLDSIAQIGAQIKKKSLVQAKNALIKLFVEIEETYKSANDSVPHSAKKEMDIVCIYIFFFFEHEPEIFQYGGFLHNTPS
jgi:hypothetical protein